MGKNNGNSWLNAVKKAFRSPEEKRSSRRRHESDQEEEEKKRGKGRWVFRKHFPLETTIQDNVAKSANREENLVGKQIRIENSLAEQRRAIAAAMAATAQAAAEIIRLTRPSLLVKEYEAAVVIQAMFRGYLARRALLALKGVVKLQALIRGHNVRKRAKMTLQCIQSLVRVQALVCDQRRRLSCEATSLGSMFSPTNSGRKSVSRNVIETGNRLEEIQALIEKAKECSLGQGKTLAHALSHHQKWSLDEDQFSKTNYADHQEQHSSPWLRQDRNLCNPRIPIKTLQIDTSTPYNLFTSSNPHDQYHDSYIVPSPVRGKHRNLSVNSPKTPPSSKIKRIQVNSCSPFHQTGETKYQTLDTPTSRPTYSHRMSMSESSSPLPRPNYMAATASAMARVRPHSTSPRRRLSSPSREPAGSAKKRLSFPVHDEPSADGKVVIQRYKCID